MRIHLTSNMAPLIAQDIEALGLPETIEALTNAHIEALWDIGRDVPLNYADDGRTLLAIPGCDGSDNEECFDEDFFIWPRGTTKLEIWRWFDDHHTLGIADW